MLSTLLLLFVTCPILLPFISPTMLTLKLPTKNPFLLSSLLLLFLPTICYYSYNDAIKTYLHSCSCSCTTDCYFSYNDHIVIIFPAHVSVLLIISTPTMMPFKLTFKKSPVVIFTPAHVDVLLIVATPKIESCLQKSCLKEIHLYYLQYCSCSFLLFVNFHTIINWNLPLRKPPVVLFTDAPAPIKLLITCSTILPFLLTFKKSKVVIFPHAFVPILLLVNSLTMLSLTIVLKKTTVLDYMLLFYSCLLLVEN